MQHTLRSLFSICLIALSSTAYSSPSMSRTIEYDSKENVKKVIYSDGSFLQYAYDSLNQVTEVSSSDEKEVYYSYDPNGNCIQIKDSIGYTAYEYDHKNRLTKIQSPLGIAIHYTYDLRGRLQSICYPSLTTVAYTYDDANRLTKVSTPSGVTRYTYDHTNNTLTSIHLPNGIYAKYMYDQAKRITELSYFKNDHSLVVRYQYSYDGNGNRLSQEITSPDQTTTTHYVYDRLNRLIQVITPNDHIQWTYDSLGNCLSKKSDAGVIHYQYNALNQLVQKGDTQYLYDKRGNLTQKISPEQTATYQYDVHDNLITYQDEKYTITYTYDGEGHRIAKTVNGETSFYFNDVLTPTTQVLVEIDEKGKLIHEFIYGLSRIAQNFACEENYYLYDFPGCNVTYLTDQDQNVLETYNYDPFGAPHFIPSDSSNPFLFAGECYEKETGLIFLRNRYYDPDMGRFISADPFIGKLTSSQSWNPYAYANNNPINLIDPLGLDSATACIYPPGTVTEQGVSLAGHGFWILRKDDGEIITSGRYPRGARDDDILPKGWGVASYTFPATDEQIDKITAEMKRGPYLLAIWGNCINGLERGLKILNVDHPSFRVLGIPTPSKALLWLESLNGKNEYSSWIQDNVNFLHSPDTFSPPPYHSPASPFGVSSATSSICPGDCGGVSLNLAAQFMTELSDIVGATFDKATDQLILVGPKSYSLPPMDFDDLAVAVRSIYGLGSQPAQHPGVSIEWNPENNKKLKKENYAHLHPMLVRYEGATENTRFGQIIFEADRVLKCLELGIDNITGKHLTPSVNEYRSMPQRQANSKTHISNWTNRMWFVPKNITLKESDTHLAMVFDRVEMQVLSESYLKGEPKRNSAAESFAHHFTNHYHAFSKEYPVLKQLSRLGKITAVVKWMYDNQIPFDLTPFKSYTPKYHPTPNSTPATMFPYVKEGMIHYVVGGVTYTLADSNFHEVFDSETDTFFEEVLTQRPSDGSMQWKLTDKNLSAVACPLNSTVKMGSISKAFTDMRFHSDKGPSLELVRYYHSFEDTPSPLGRGWSLLPASLSFPSEKRIIYWGEDQLMVPAYSKIIVRYNGVRKPFHLLGINEDSLPVYSSSEIQMLLHQQENGELILTIPNERKLFFDPSGKLFQMTERSNHSTFYQFEDDQLHSIHNSYGQKIDFKYENGKIIAIEGPGEKVIHYHYDHSHRLSSVGDTMGILTYYRYDAHSNLSGVYFADMEPIFLAEYDLYHRATAIQEGGHSVTSEYNQTKHTMTQSLNGLASFSNQYNENYQLLRSSNSFGKNIEITYYDGTPYPHIIQNNNGNKAELSYDSKGNLTSITNQAGNKQRFWYNQNNQLTAIQDGRGWCSLYTYDEQSRLKSIHPKCHITFEDPVTGKIGFHYEQQDMIEHIFDDQGEFSQFYGGKHLRNYSYDCFGRLASISDPYGYKIMRYYDDRFRLTALFDRDGGYDFQYNDRDQVTQVDSPVGFVKYDYDIRGNLTRTTDPNGNNTLFEYDSHSNLIKVIDAEGGVTLYEYTALGTLSHITLPNGSVREIEYNCLNHPVLEIVR